MKLSVLLIADQDHRIVSVSGHGSEPKHMFALYLSFTNNAQVMILNMLHKVLLIINL